MNNFIILEHITKQNFPQNYYSVSPILLLALILLIN